MKNELAAWAFKDGARCHQAITMAIAGSPAKAILGNQQRVASAELLYCEKFVEWREISVCDCGRGHAIGLRGVSESLDAFNFE
jgi:hypothetical protein